MRTFNASDIARPPRRARTSSERPVKRRDYPFFVTGKPGAVHVAPSETRTAVAPESAPRGEGDSC